VAKLGDNDARAIASGVCYCCKTSVVAGADGSIYATWRHVYPGNIRDIAFTMSRDAGRTFATPIRVSSDQWVLNGCPENGPAMALGAVNTVHVVWPTLVNASGGEPTLELFYAATQDGRRFSARQRIPTSGTPRHPQVASAPDGSLLAVWDEQIDGTRRVAVAKGVKVATDRIGFTRVPVDERLRAEYPVVATMAGGYVVAWASGQGQQSTIRVQRFDD
jgi:hypothetical protein